MNLPNLLSLVRVIIAPLFVWVFAQEGWVYALLALVLSAIIEATDFLDGYIARSRNLVTDFGKLFDPISDRISRFIIFMTFMYHGLVPLWMLVIIYLRDEIVSFVRMLAANRNIVVAARPSGKIKAVSQAIAINIVLMVRFAFIVSGASRESYDQYVGGAAWWLMAVVTLVTFVSIFDYAGGNWRIVSSYLKEERSAETKEENHD